MADGDFASLRYRDWLAVSGMIDRQNGVRARRGEQAVPFPPPPKGSFDDLRPELNHYPNPPPVVAMGGTTLSDVAGNGARDVVPPVALPGATVEHGESSLQSSRLGDGAGQGLLPDGNTNGPIEVGYQPPGAAMGASAVVSDASSGTRLAALCTAETRPTAMVPEARARRAARGRAGKAQP